MTTPGADVPDAPDAPDAAGAGGAGGAGGSLRLLRADHVGGLPRPAWLRERQAGFQRGEVSAAELERDHQRAVAGLVRRQLDIGLPILTDGEITRRNFQESFGGAVTGYDARPYEYPLTVAPAGAPVRRPTDTVPGTVSDTMPDTVPLVRAPSGMPEDGPAVLHRRPVTKRLRPSRNLVLEEFRRASAIASATGPATRPATGPATGSATGSAPVKVTLIGPDRIAQRFAHEASRDVYPDMDAFVADVVAIERQMIGEVIAAGCRYVQIDEPGYTAYVDEPSLAEMRGRGEDPDRNLARGIAADNALLAGFGGDDGVTFAVHICRGGGGGRGGDWVHREGSYDAIAERLYGELNFDRFLLEYDSDAAGGFDSLRYLPRTKIAVLGLVSNNGGLETRDYLNRRLAEATRHIPVDQVAICPRCGFGGSNSTEADIWRKLELIIQIANETWPSGRA
jgi:5-methyltetrahydropteroyltriglutamate--homocysteine methyltransferase